MSVSQSDRSPEMVRARAIEVAARRALPLLREYHDQILAITGSADGWLVIDELEFVLGGTVGAGGDHTPSRGRNET